MAPLQAAGWRRSVRLATLCAIWCLPRAGRQRTMEVPVTKCFAQLATIFLLFGAGCNRPAPADSADRVDTAAPAAAEQPSAAPAAIPETLPAPLSSWKVSGGLSEQEKTVSNMSSSGRLRLLVRESGGKVECLFSS